ncbi:MAG TPA: hypothetical protein PLK94_14600 [Alphaproteobacteria bacterium]|nr:hypothetical protein [Alphaproteobacteria bacterium]HOO52502.1 hypothetical protein [Alphaproteobacteria bacterium]
MEVENFRHWDYTPLVIGVGICAFVIFSIFKGKISLNFRIKPLYRRKFVFTWKEDPIDFVVIIVLALIFAAFSFYVYFTNI